MKGPDKNTLPLKPLAWALLVAGSLATAPVSAEPIGSKSTAEQAAADPAEDGNNMQKDVHDGWLEGKLEMAFLLNRHLNNFTIDPEVNGDKVVLNGTVNSDVDRDLAKEIAISVDGVESVDNQLQVRASDGENTAEDDNSNDFARNIEDATLTAEIKIKLLANENTEGLDINVDTDNGVVTLEGTVADDTRKELAGTLAANVDGVSKVVNNLKVSG